MAELHESYKTRSARGVFRNLAALIPPLAWLPNYDLAWLGRDAIAGITLAAYAIPVSLAYATLAGLPPHYGIYCYLVGGFAYAVFGTSRQLAVGPTSAIAMMVGTTVAGMAAGDAEHAAAISALVALVVALFGGIAWLLKLSGLVSFISETILTGFKAGAAITIAMTQLPKFFGVPGGGEHFFERLWLLATQLGQTNRAVLVLGAVALTILVLGNQLFPGRPVALFVVGLSILAVAYWHLDQHGVSIVGTIPAGLPELAWPSLRLRDVDGVLAQVARPNRVSSSRRWRPRPPSRCRRLRYLAGQHRPLTLGRQRRGFHRECRCPRADECIDTPHGTVGTVPSPTSC